MTVPPARPASTVILMRQAASGLEVFLVRRHDNVAFMGGAHVFPGGRVDATDYLPDAEASCDGVAGAAARMADLPAAEAVAFHVAAIRELFEEAGVLLARERGGGGVTFDDASADRFAEYRHALATGAVTIRDLATREQLRLALDALAFCAHWVTPEIEKRRFDTRFFLALAPGGQIAAHDERETTHGAWMTPAEAIDRCRLGDIALPPPTWTTLRFLARFGLTDDAWGWAQAHPVPRVQPGFIQRDDGTRLVTLPGDPLCPAVAGFNAEETRFLLADGRWTPVPPE